MVSKVHEYANGGQVEDHTSTNFRWPKPSYIEAMVDRTKELRDRAAANWRALKGAVSSEPSERPEPKHGGKTYEDIVDE
jgi:hypothetical protein